MKKFLSILFAVLLLCVSVVPSYAASYAISVKAPSAATVGETITVSVKLSANSGLGGLDFTVKFNTADFQYVSGSAQASSLLMAETKEGTGSIKYAGITAGTVTSGGTLMTFKVKVLKTGGRITVSVNDAVDGNDKDIKSSFSTTGATVKCSHANAKWVVTKKATCTENGSEKRTCTCGDVSTRDIAKTDHTYGKWTVEKEATETQKGLKWAKCSVCGDKKEQAIPVITTTTTETTTTKEETTENTTEEQTTAPTVDIVEKLSTPKIVAITVFAVLGIEAIGLLIFFAIKKKKAQ